MLTSTLIRPGLLTIEPIDASQPADEHAKEPMTRTARLTAVAILAQVDVKQVSRTASDAIATKERTYSAILRRYDCQAQGYTPAIGDLITGFSYGGQMRLSRSDNVYVDAVEPWCEGDGWVLTCKARKTRRV